MRVVARGSVSGMSAFCCGGRYDGRHLAADDWFDGAEVDGANTMRV